MIRAEMLYSRVPSTGESKRWIAFHLSGEHKIDPDNALRDICHVNPALFIKYPVTSLLHPRRYAYVHKDDQKAESFMQGEVKFRETVVAWPLTYGQDTVRLREFEEIIIRWSKITQKPVKGVLDIQGWHAILNQEIKERIQQGNPIEISIRKGFDIFSSRETEDMAVIKLSEIYFPLCKPEDLPLEIFGTEGGHYFIISIVNNVSTYIDTTTDRPGMYATVSLDITHPTMFVGLLLSQPTWQSGSAERFGKQLEDYIRKKNPHHPLAARDIPGWKEVKPALDQLKNKKTTGR